MMRYVLLFCIFYFCNGSEDDREPKFFFGPGRTVVSFRRVPEYVTEFVPSSCVVVEPTLPPCRHVRNLEIYPSVPTRVSPTQSPQAEVPQKETPQPNENSNRNPTPPLRVRPQQIKSSSPYWNWNFLNPFRTQSVTQTSTKTELFTTKVEDPHTVVSFYIKGCRPSKLPFNLPECVRPELTFRPPEKSMVVIAPLKFVTKVDGTITPTRAAVEDLGEGREADLNTTTPDVNQIY